MNPATSQPAYHAALSLAQGELNEILPRFNSLMSRKEQLEGALSFLEALLATEEYDTPDIQPVAVAPPQPSIETPPAAPAPAQSRLARLVESANPFFKPAQAPSTQEDPIQKRINSALGISPVA